MTTFKATITKPELFCAAAAFISTEETRYYLRGVYIEPAAVGGAYLVTTDGHSLFCGYDEKATVNRVAIITPPKQRMPAKWWNDGELTLDGETARHSIGLIEGAGEIDGTFPDYRRVIPSEFSGLYGVAPRHNKHRTQINSPSRITFAPDKLMEFAKVDKALNNYGTINALRMTPNDTGPALIALRDDAFGILMPVRAGQASDPWPALPAFTDAMRSNEIPEAQAAE